MICYLPNCTTFRVTKNVRRDEVQRPGQPVHLDAEEQVIRRQAVQVPEVPRHLLQALRLLQRDSADPPLARQGARDVRAEGVRARHVPRRRPRHVARLRGRPPPL